MAKDTRPWTSSSSWTSRSTAARPQHTANENFLCWIPAMFAWGPCGCGIFHGRLRWLRPFGRSTVPDLDPRKIATHFDSDSQFFLEQTWCCISKIAQLVRRQHAELPAPRQHWVSQSLSDDLCKKRTFFFFFFRCGLTNPKKEKLSLKTRAIGTKSPVGNTWTTTSSTWTGSSSWTTRSICQEDLSERSFDGISSKLWAMFFNDQKPMKGAVHPHSDVFFEQTGILYGWSQVKFPTASWMQIFCDLRKSVKDGFGSLGMVQHSRFQEISYGISFWFFLHGFKGSWTKSWGSRLLTYRGPKPAPTRPPLRCWRLEARGKSQASRCFWAGWYFNWVYF